jgi:hypothetical protein
METVRQWLRELWLLARQITPLRRFRYRNDAERFQAWEDYRAGWRKIRD